MVKGVSRRVIMIKSPDPELFDEAIFVVREDILHRGVTSAQIVSEAKKIADGYISPGAGAKKRKYLPPAVYMLMGAVAMALLWAAQCFLF